MTETVQSQQWDGGRERGGAGEVVGTSAEDVHYGLLHRGQGRLGYCRVNSSLDSLIRAHSGPN